MTYGPGNVIDSFSGTHNFLSNFYSASVEYEGVIYGTVEAAYQAAKSLDPTIRQLFTKYGPAEAKRKGRKVPLRPDWETVKIEIMRQLLRDKFRPGRTYHDQLLMTQPHALVEGNYWGDTFWGVCNGVGENWLGRLLMEIRDAASTEQTHGD